MATTSGGIVDDPRTTEDVIELGNVRKAFGSRVVLDDISLGVQHGEILGLLGPSGAGKTTLIKIMLGLLAPDAGEVSVFSHPPRAFSSDASKRIGVVLDDPCLYERLTCTENLKVFLKARGIKDMGCADKILKRVGLDKSRSVCAQDLSKGMRQRLSLARALMHDPELLFLDEPTSGLDPGTAEDIHALLLKRRATGVTIFLTTHNMEEATKICDRVILLNEGRIVEAGAPREICARHSKEHCVTVIQGKRSFRFSDINKDADKICAILKAGNVTSISTESPNLEAVFLQLTGRELE